MVCISCQIEAQNHIIIAIVHDLKKVIGNKFNDEGHRVKITTTNRTRKLSSLHQGDHPDGDCRITGNDATKFFCMFDLPREDLTQGNVFETRAN